MAASIKKALSFLLRIGISSILLIFLFKQVDGKTLFQIIKKTDKICLFWAFSLSFFVYILCFLRWNMLLKAVDIRLPLKRVIISFAGGVFFNTFLPSTIGGDLVRTMDLAVHTKKPREVVATVLLDRLSGYVGLVALTLFALSLGWRLVRDRTVVLSVAIIASILIAILVALFNNFIFNKLNRILYAPGASKIREKLANLHQQIHVFRNYKKLLLHNVILSILVQSVAPVAYYFLALSLGYRLNIVCFFILLPLIGAITLLPISLGGIGLKDVSTIYFFAKVGMGKDAAFAMSILAFFIMLVYTSIGGLVYVLAVHYRRIQHHQPPRI